MKRSPSSPFVDIAMAAVAQAPISGGETVAGYFAVGHGPLEVSRIRGEAAARPVVLPLPNMPKDQLVPYGQQTDLPSSAAVVPRHGAGRVGAVLTD